MTKKIGFILIATIVAITISCGRKDNEAIRALRDDIAVSAATCPIQLGLTGRLESIVYDEDNNDVIFNYIFNPAYSNIDTMEDNDETRANLRSMLLAPESYTMLVLLAAANASITMDMKSTASDREIKIHMNASEIKDLAAQKAANLEIIERLTSEMNGLCPIELEEGMNLTEIALINGWVQYTCNLNTPAAELTSQTQMDLRDLITGKLRSEAETNENTRNYIDALVSTGYGIRYLFRLPDEHTLTLDISTEQLAEF